MSVFAVPIFGLKFVIPSFALLLSLLLFFHKGIAKKFVKYLPHTVSAMILLVSLIYFVIMLVVETKGIDMSNYIEYTDLQVNGYGSNEILKNCDIIPLLLSSKDGYLRE